jgi:hypothetical protein
MIDEDMIYEHEVVTTVRITVRSLEPYLDKAKFLEDYAYLTDFSDYLDSDDYPRVVATSVVSDDVEYMNKEMEDE